MSDKRLTAEEIKASIRETERELCRLKNQLNGLTQQEYENVLEELKPLINKCFVKVTPNHDGSTTRHYAVITGYPAIESTRTSVSFNRYQIPAIHFYINDRHFAPCMMCHEYKSDEEVFYFETVFAGELPEPWKAGAHNAMQNPEWVEVSHTEFINAAERRYREYIRKIFEPTTPPL